MTDPGAERGSGGLLALAQHYLHILLKWKWMAGIVCCVIVGGAVAYALRTPPVYISTGTVWIEEQANILPFEDVQRLDNSYLSSQSRLLESRALASAVIEKLKLYENPHFAGVPAKGAKPPDPNDPVFRERLILKFLNRITIKSAARTRLVEVTFSDGNPRFASETLNTLFDSYVELIVRQRYQTSEQAAEFLKAQIAAVSTEIEEGEKKLAEYGTAQDILPLTSAEAPIVNRLSTLDKNLTDAKIERINKFNAYNQLKAATLGDVPEAFNGPTIQKLREQYTTLSREYAKKLGTLRPEYPEMQRMKTELDTIKADLERETKNLVNAAYAEYQVALGAEASVQKLLDEQRNAAFKANSSSVVYNSLRVELENKKALLEALSKRQSETDISSRLKGLEAGNVWVVDKADLPLRPASPNKRKIALYGLILGLATGFGLAFFIEYLNATVKTSKDVATTTGLATLGVIPAFDREIASKGLFGEIRRLRRIVGKKRLPTTAKLIDRPGGNGGPKARAAAEKWEKKHGPFIELIASREPRSIQAESFRSIRTTLLVSAPPGKIKSLLFTSPLAREGKSSTVANLGVTLAQSGKKVIIIDSDLRKPKQARIFGSTNGFGLSNFLSSHLDPLEVVRPTSFQNLMLIDSGPIPSNPIDLLTSERMDDMIAFLKRTYDYALFDAPPVLAVSDALAMAPMIDSVVLVVRGGQTPLSALKQAQQKFDAHKLKCLGVILNGVNLVEQEGSYAKQYYEYYRGA